jgi:hypothetical protein
MKTTFGLLVFCLCGAIAFAQKGNTTPSAEATKTAKSFLDAIAAGQPDEALKLWDSTAVNDKLKERVQKMSAKVAKLGGIKKDGVLVGDCEQRRMDAHEKKTGEKIGVVPVEIICGSEDLLLVVFSTRKVDGKDKIFMIESLKEWGGTASLDEELGYQH